MSEVLIDVTWRGLEVGRQVPLRELTDEHGRVDVALPMPVGSALSLRAGGLEIPATVTRVLEQTSGGGETPGMVVAPTLDSPARAWWSARAAELEAAVPPSPPTSDEPIVTVAPIDPASTPTMVFHAVQLSDIKAGVSTSLAHSVAAPPVSSPVTSPVTAPVTAPATAPVTAPMTAPVTAPVTAPMATPVIHAVVPTAPRHPGFDEGASASTELPSAALTADDRHAARSTVTHDAVADLAGSIAESAADDEAPRPPVLAGEGRRAAMMAALVHPDEPSDDTSQTTVMAAVDIEAIMADGASQPELAGSGNGDENGVVEGGVTGETSGDATGDSGPRKGTSKPNVARGKRRRGR